MTTMSEDDDVCPVCLVNQPDELLMGPCGHGICHSCIHRILCSASASSSYRTRFTNNDDTAIMNNYFPTDEMCLDAPTLGRCPICRSKLSLFDLKYKSSGIDAISKKYNTALPIELSNNGKIFIKSGKSVGNESIHFPSSSSNNNNNEDTPSTNTPYVCFSGENWKLDDGSKLPDRKYFDQFYFHEGTNSFHGTLFWNKKIDSDNGDNDECSATACKSKRAKGSNQWDYILGFSSEYRHIARGLITIRKNPYRNKNKIKGEQEYNGEDESCSKYYGYKFPFDGRWKVSISSLGDTGTAASSSEESILVHGNKFLYHHPNGNGYGYNDGQSPNHLDFTDPLRPVIVWNDNKERQRMADTFNANDDVVNVPVGGSVQWVALSKNRPQLVWTRLSVESDNGVPLQVTQLGADHPDKTFYLLDTISQHDTPPYNENTVWGNTFCQSYTVGLASYHFMEDQSGAYISYEHEHTAVWPALDNGNPIPSRIWFTNIVFDEGTKTFRGDIDWVGTHGTSWQGDRIWRYEMQFSTDYSCIITGKVNSIRGTHVVSEWVRFGRELMYVNVGLIEKLKDDTAGNRGEFVRRVGQISSSISDEVNGLVEIDGDANRFQRFLRMASSVEISYPRTI